MRRRKARGAAGSAGRPAFREWCGRATEDIRGTRRRREVYRELYGHLEERFDSLAALGLSEEEAEKKALLAAGDAGVIAPQLGAVHRPIWSCALAELRAALLILLCAAAVYVLLGTPPLTAQMQLRRIERMNGTGRSELIAELELGDEYFWPRLVVGETPDAAVLYSYSPEDPDPSREYDLRFPTETFAHAEKTDGLALLSVYPDFYRCETAFLTLVLVDPYPEAVRAELDITLNDELELMNYYDGQDGGFEHTYRLESARLHEGLFLFTLECASDPPLDAEVYALKRFAGIRMGEGYLNALPPASLRLYGPDGGLICERELDVGS